MIGYRAEGTICNDRRPSQNLARGLEGDVSPLQWVQDRALERPQRENPPEALKILKFALQKRGQKLTIMCIFNPRHANDNILIS